MPRVNIREIDNTGSDTRSYIENIALLPALKIEGYDKDRNLITVDGTYTTLSAFEAQVLKVFETISVEWESGDEVEQKAKDELIRMKDVFIQDKGYAMAHILLTYGLPIDYKGLYTLTINSQESGEYVTVEPNIDDLKDSGLLSKLYDDYSDKAKYDGKFILPPYIDLNVKEEEEIIDGQVVPGIKERFILASDTLAIKCGGTRGDSYGLVYSPNYLKDAKEVDTWIQNNFSQTCGNPIPRPAVSWAVNETTEVFGSYGTHFRSNFIIPKYKITAPFLYAEEKQLKAVEYTFINAVFPAYLDYLLCYVTHTKVTPDWFAISGATRGACPLSSIKLIEKYGDADIDLFQPRDGDDNKGHIATNAICNIRPYGDIIWGNRTMHPLNVPANGSSDAVQLVASDFLNIRSLCCDIKKAVYRAARRYTFDPNTDELWFNFKSMITPLLEKMKSNQGIRDYQYIKVATKKKALLAAKIIITPIEAVEDFDITIQLDDSIEVAQN